MQTHTGREEAQREEVSVCWPPPVPLPISSHPTELITLRICSPSASQPASSPTLPWLTTLRTHGLTLAWPLPTYPRAACLTQARASTALLRNQHIPAFTGARPPCCGEGREEVGHFPFTEAETMVGRGCWVICPR